MSAWPVTLLMGATFAFAQLQALPPAPAQKPTAAQAQQKGPLPPQPRGRFFETVVIDPGHGGADSGARGSDGLIEKDLTLAWAKRLRVELQSRLQITVLLTRDRDVTPTLDERAGMANSSRADLFLSLHVATTGPPRTARVYTWRGIESAAGPPEVAPAKFIPWETAQMRSTTDSERFAELLEAELQRALPGSLAKPGQAPLRVLRSVVGPAVAVEVSNASLKAEELAGVDQALARALAAAIQAFKPGYERAAEVGNPAPSSPEAPPAAKPTAENTGASKP